VSVNHLLRQGMSPAKHAGPALPQATGAHATAAQQEIRFCKSSDGVDLAMALYGAGPPLVKAATWLTHVEFDQTSPLDRAVINEFSPRFRYVTYDARGCGLSQRRVDDISFDALGLKDSRCWVSPRAPQSPSPMRHGIRSASASWS
jgi:hypothetical protein